MTKEGPILLVEDNPDDEALTLRALRGHGVTNEVVVARDGVEALAYLFGPEAHGRGMPVLVLLDLKLPKVDGVDVLKRLRAEPRTRYVPVVVLTSSGEERDMVRTYDHGANSYIRKPVDFAEFTAAINQLKMYWLLLNATPQAGD